MSDLSERLRELAFSFDGRSEENASLLREAADALDAAEKERDAAVQFIGVANEEFVLRGYPGGDRTVVLANIRALPPQSQSAEER